jgi:hypothetical protein
MAYHSLWLLDETGATGIGGSSVDVRVFFSFENEFTKFTKLDTLSKKKDESPTRNRANGSTNTNHKIEYLKNGKLSCVIRYTGIPGTLAGGIPTTLPPF